MSVVRNRLVKAQKNFSQRCLSFLSSRANLVVHRTSTSTYKTRASFSVSEPVSSSRYKGVKKDGRPRRHFRWEEIKFRSLPKLHTGTV